MDLSSLKPAKGSVKNKKRIGRGQGSGKGGTSTRGLNGAKSRSGYSKKLGFEGGQMPIHRRLPKYGFNNPFRTEYVGVNIDVVSGIAKKCGIDKVGIEDFINNGIASKNDLIKILGRGEIDLALKVEAHAFSKKAKEQIESKGGTALIVK